MGSNLGSRVSKLGFWGEKWVFLDSSLSLLAMASEFTREAICTVTSSPVSRFCVCFTCFCFELAFGVNMKVLDN